MKKFCCVNHCKCCWYEEMCISGERWSPEIGNRRYVATIRILQDCFVLARRKIWIQDWMRSRNSSQPRGGHSCITTGACVGGTSPLVASVGVAVTVTRRVRSTASATETRSCHLTTHDVNVRIADRVDTHTGPGNTGSPETKPTFW